MIFRPRRISRYCLAPLLAGLLLAGAARAQVTAGPSITALFPVSAPAGSSNLQLFITGGNFQPGAVVQWNGTALPTTFISNSQLNAVIPAALLANPGFATVTVLNLDGRPSAPASFTITAAQLAVTSRTLPAAAAGITYSVTLAAAGGLPPYTWSAPEPLPNGLTLSVAGTISGTPASAGTYSFTVQVTDSNRATASAVLSLTVTPQQFTISTPSPLPAGTVGVPYVLTFAATAGTTPYRWSISGLPPEGLGFDAAGATLRGTPRAAGTSSFSIQVTDSAGNTASRTYTITVNAPQLTITTEQPLFDATVGSFYSQAFAAAGGVPPYKWAITAGQPPAGMTFDTTGGALTGTPTTKGAFTFTVQVADSRGTTVSKPFTVTVNLPRLSITTASPLAEGRVDSPYEQQFAATGGAPPYTWSITAGAVTGLTLSSSGLLSGTASAPGTFSFTVQVRDSGGATATRAFTLLINPKPLAITSATNLPNAALATPYSYTLAASGGVPPYTWSANGLPKGLEIDGATGAITGAPEVAGQLIFTARVADSARSAATTLFRINIDLPPAPAVRITGLPSTTDPADQRNLSVALAAAYPVAISGQLTLAFAPETGAGDSTIQFSTGGRSASFTIPAGSLDAVFPGGAIGLQTGTVAGDITVAARLSAGGVDLSPSPAGSVAGHVNRGAPVIRSARLVRAANGFSIQVVGFATSREVTQAVLRFTAAPGSSLQQSEITVQVESLFSAWYQDTASSRFGSQFTFTQPFTVQGGDASAVTPDSVTLVNRIGSATAKIN